MTISHATLMYCCLSARSTGMVSRALATAEQLSEYFDVTLVLDESAWDATLIDSETRILQVGNGAPGGLAQEPPPVAQAESNRRDRLLEAMRRLRPRVLLVDGFPLDRKELAEEFLPLITAAREERPGDVFVASVSDCVMGDTFFQSTREADHCARILNRVFDAAIVRSDPVFARLEEFFQPRMVKHIPVYHAGFVPLQAGDLSRLYANRRGIVVCPRDGAHGEALMHAAIEAHRILQGNLREEMTIIGGTRLSDQGWRRLQQRAAAVPRVNLKRFCPDVGYQMASARWCISDCDPDRALNVLRSGTRSILVPGDPENEQVERARRLVYWGAGRMLMPRHLNGASLANELHQLTKLRCKQAVLNMQGASNIAKFLVQAVYRQNPCRVAIPHAGGRRLH